MHKPKYDYVKHTAPKRSFEHKELCKLNDKSFRVAPCVIDQAECTYEARVKGAREHRQQFNSVLQGPEPYLRTRNASEDFRPLMAKTQYKLRRVNVTEMTAKEVEARTNKYNTRKGKSSSPKKERSPSGKTVGPADGDGDDQEPGNVDTVEMLGAVKKALGDKYADNLAALKDSIPGDGSGAGDGAGGAEQGEARESSLEVGEFRKTKIIQALE